LVTQGYDALVVAVNVSPRQFSHPDFYQAVVDALDNSKLAPQHLELEITEGVVMHNEQVVIQQLQRYKQLGIQLSIDDFGTGYSSLSYLKQFPVDKLKIDQSFIRQSHENSDDRILVESIVNLAHSLRLNVIAEGVELREHTEWLAALSCDEIQGYWFSRPLPATAVVPLLMSHKPSEFKCKPN
jgi:EAL domain-containing protein (putative c-di-GMP-specific phosphodiesterase class I)